MNDGFDMDMALGGVLALALVLLARFIPAGSQGWYISWWAMIILGAYIVVRHHFTRRKQK